MNDPSDKSRSQDLKDLRKRVAASRARQGLPPVIEDLAVIERVVNIFALIEPKIERNRSRVR